MIVPGRWCDLNNVREVPPEELAYGMDFREPRYRRAVFLRFYEFHLKHRAHPGAVYYLLPWLAKTYQWQDEHKLWFAYINGNTQNPLTSFVIMREFPDVHTLDVEQLRVWFEHHYDQLAFDTDRRYFKKKFIDCVENYKSLLRGRPQKDFFKRIGHEDAQGNFQQLWSYCNLNYIFFGRLSVFSYLEYLRISGLDVECNQLFLHDMSGSKSHRNGLCKVLGRDDLDWHDSNPDFDGRYDAPTLAWLAEEGEQLLVEVRARMRGKDYAQDIGYFTLESALCTYKSWHRPNRRYPNCYNDMLVDRILACEAHWGAMTSFWLARKHTLPKHLRLEENPADCGLKPKKQNFYREQGCPVMMHKDWSCFANAFNDEIMQKQGELP